MTAEMNRRERMEEQDSVKVCVRIRPLSSKEKQEQTKSCIRIAASFDGLSTTTSASRIDDNTQSPQQLIVGKDRAFTFDNVLGVTSSQTETYHHCVAPLVQGFLDGYNATVLAYGQTGTGKTHTMAGSGFDARGCEKNGELQGIIPRVINAVFEKLQQNEEGSDNQRRQEYSLRVEYVEIYNEELRDLLHPETSSKQLAIREDGEGNIVIAGIKSERADSIETVFRHLVVGGASRVTGSTLMNEQSSRSHAIFTLLLEQRDLTLGTRRFSKFHLVDLAGSERAKRTGAVAGRFKESVNINQGLLSLGNVISALGDEKRRLGTAGSGSATIHVPYRDSKLTRLLQDSLGGNARTLMIACVSPASVNFEETLNTLKYANRAKNIKNKPIVNDHLPTEDERLRSDEEMTRMREEISHLQTQLRQQKQVPKQSRPPSRPASSSRNAEHVASRDVTQLTKCVDFYSEAVATIRSYSMEAATLLVAMEREIKALGRPVQQKLNEIVKLLNASIQTANVSIINAKKLQPSLKDAKLPSSEDQTEESAALVKKLRHELKEATTNLARDEQIFEMKNTDIQKLQALLVEAKGKNKKLIERVQELERGGQLWSNSRALESEDGISNEQASESSNRSATAPTASERTSRSSLSSRNKPLHSSRGLFTRQGGSTPYRGDDDKVVMDSSIDDETYTRISSASRKSGSKSAPGGSRNAASTRGEGTPFTGSRLKTSEAIGKLETTITALQAKLEELQKKNEELLDAREESTRRWALERQSYERQLSDAEHSIEALKRDNQVLEDSVLDGAHSEAKESVNRNSTCVNGCHDQKATIALGRSETRASSESRSKRTAVPPVTKDVVVSAFENSVKELIEYHATRREVVHLLKEKKEAKQTRNEAARRVNALEMQKMRQSVGVRESISDLSKSLHILDERMLAETKSREELERLKKLRVRAEQKLTKLRQQEEKAEFLQAEAQQELQDLEELIVDLDSHIAFQDAELVAARNDLLAIKQRSDAKSPLDGLAQKFVQQLGLINEDVGNVTISVISKCLDEVARLRIRVNDLGSDVQELQGLVTNREAVIGQLESGLAVARDEFERRLAVQQQESAETMEHLKKMQPQILMPSPSEDDNVGKKDQEWQKLIVRCQKKDEYIAEIEKHLVFYKSKAKQMQAQLQQLIRASSEQQRQAEDESQPGERERQVQRRIQQLESANDALMKDLASAKVYLRASQSRGSIAKTSAERAEAKVVRISKSELRELPAPPKNHPEENRQNK